MGNCLVKHSYEKTWVPLLSAYPSHGFSHRLDQDKQHELAHAVKYDGQSHCSKHHSRKGIIHPTRTLRCVSSCTMNLRDSCTKITSVNVLLPVNMALNPCGQSESVSDSSAGPPSPCKDSASREQDKMSVLIFYAEVQPIFAIAKKSKKT